jgi:general secretion pathway protein G
MMVMDGNGKGARCSRPAPTLESRLHWRQRGFTLLEMVVVISIMLVLVSIAVPAYNRSIIRAREAVLRQDLFTLRSVINQYTDDKQKAPQSLDDLVTASYLKQIPVDPFTNSNGTWQVVQEDALMSVDQQEPGISDVHSGSDQLSSEGTAYSQW